MISAQLATSSDGHVESELCAPRHRNPFRHIMSSASGEEWFDVRLTVIDPNESAYCWFFSGPWPECQGTDGLASIPAVLLGLRRRAGDAPRARNDAALRSGNSPAAYSVVLEVRPDGSAIRAVTRQYT